MQPLSKAKIKLFTSLTSKKYRYRNRMFLAEGKKLVHEAINSGWKIEALIIREDIRTENMPFPSDVPLYSATEKMIREISTLQTPEGLMAVVHFPFPEFGLPGMCKTLPKGPGLILDDIRDPGNLGTIIRTASWFNFDAVVLSPATVDVLNPKCLRGSMGGIFHINLVCCENLTEVLKLEADRCWLADMEGEALDEIQFSPRDFLVIGNESHGVSPLLKNISSLRRLRIPGSGNPESLNAAVAAGILSWKLYTG